MARMVKIEPEERVECDTNGYRRNAIKEEHGIGTRKISAKHTDEELHHQEVLGQYAVSKFFGVPMDWSVCIGGNKRPHFVINGVSMRVQMPTHHPPILKFNRPEDFDTDIMVLCYEFDDPESPGWIGIYGCVSRERFMREHKMQNFQYGERLVMQAQYMTPIEDYLIEAGREVEKKEPGMEGGPARGQERNTA